MLIEEYFVRWEVIEMMGSLFQIAIFCMSLWLVWNLQTNFDKHENCRNGVWLSSRVHLLASDFTVGDFRMSLLTSFAEHSYP